MRINKLVITFVCTVLAVTSAYAQNETGVRTIDSAAIGRYKKRHLWYDSTSAQFQTKYPIIRNIPPLSTDMPLDVLVGYIAVDSILKIAPSPWALRSRLMDQMTEPRNLDTIYKIMKYWYKMADYNPVIYQQFESETIIDPYNKYKANPSDITGTILDGIMRSVKDSLVRKKRNIWHAMLATDYILRVKVKSVNCERNKGSDIHPDLCQVYAEVIDTLKGKVFKSVMQPQTNSYSTENTPLPVMCFQYRKSDNLLGVDMSGLPYYYDKLDTAFKDGHSYKMSVGQEMIVFLTITNHLLDHTSDYYGILIEPWACAGAIRIENGNVKDINKIWSDNETIPYAQWKEIFTTWKNQLIQN